MIINSYLLFIVICSPAFVTDQFGPGIGNRRESKGHRARSGVKVEACVDGVLHDNEYN